MGIKDLYRFPFPTPPSHTKLHNALTHLKRLKALDSYNEDQINSFKDKSKITPLGSTLNVIPLAPRFAKILLMGRVKKCLGYNLLLVAGLSTEELFKRNFQF